MNVGGDELIATILLSAAVALGLGFFFLLVLLGRRIWAWMIGGPSRTRSQRKETNKPNPAPEAPYVPMITAADLYAIRSNLDAVSRQIEDLERRLRLHSIAPANVVELPRK